MSDKSKDKLKICYDRMLPRDLAQPHQTMRSMRPDGVQRAIIVFRKLWVNGSNLRVRFMGGTTAQQAIAKEQAQWWTQHANLKFEFNNALDADIRVTFDPRTGRGPISVPTARVFRPMRRR